MFRNISVVLQAIGGPAFVTQMGAAGRSVDEFGNKSEMVGQKTESVTRAMNALGKAAVAIGVVIAAGFAASVVAAAGFEREMRNVATISASTRADFEKTGDALIDMSRKLPQSAKELASGLYDIASSGFDGAEGMAVLRASAMGASAGLTTTAVAAKGVTAVLNAYGMSGYEAARVSDVLFQTVNLGVLTFEELASNLGDFVGTASILKVPIDAAASALATMTLSGISAAESATALNRVFLAFIDPSEQMTAVLKKNNFETGSAAIEALGLKGAMELLGRETGGSVEQMRALFPEVRGLKGALALLANEGENYNRVAAGVTSETERMGATQRAFNEQSKGFSFQMELAKNSLMALGIELGQAVLPFLTTLATTITSVAGAFGDLPGPVKAVVAALTGMVGLAALLGGSFVLLAPKLLAVSELMTKLAPAGSNAAAALGTLGRAAGVVGLVLAAAGVAWTIYSRQQQEAKDMVLAFTEALEAERKGIKGATDAAIQATLVQEGLIGRASRMGISYLELTDAVNGSEKAMGAMASRSSAIVGTIGQQGGAMAGLGKQTNIAQVETNDFNAAVGRVREALEKAREKVEAQKQETQLLMDVTGKSKKELQEMGLVTETAGDKIEEAAQSIGLTTKQFAAMGIASETAAEQFAKSVTSVMEATSKAFMKDFDVVAQFSASNWEKMKKDAESGVGDIAKAEEKLADARRAQSELQERLAEKTSLSVADHQNLAKAQEKVTEATEALAAAQDKGASSMGSMSDEIAKFYRTSITEANEFSTNIAKAIQMGLDPAVVTRLLTEGPKQAAPLLQEIVGGHGAALVRLMNESEQALAKSSGLAIEMARLTQLAVSSGSFRMGKDLKTAMEIVQREAAAGGKLTMEALAFSMNMGVGRVKEVVDSFGLEVAEDFKVISTESVKAWRLGIDPMPAETSSVMYLIDETVRTRLSPLPGFTRDTGAELANFWRTGLDPMPGDTGERAENTANMLRNTLDPLPGDSANIAYNTVHAWLRELAKGTGGTSEQTAAWARAMLEKLNPILEGIGGVPIQDPGTTYEFAKGGIIEFYAKGGFSEDHVAQIAPAGAMRVWAEEETGGEAYIPLAESKRDRSTGILRQVAERFGMELVAYAEGGIDSLPRPPDLSMYGTMVGYTADETNQYTFEKVRAYVEQKEREKAERAKSGEVGDGSIGEGWREITNYLDSVGQDYTITSTYRPGAITSSGNLSNHALGKAVDMVGDMEAIFRTLLNIGSSLSELYFDPMGFSVKGGQRVDWTVGGHDDHVHAATFDQGGLVYPGWNRIYNATGANEYLSPVEGLVRFSNGGLIAYGQDPGDVGGVVRDEHGKIVGYSDPSFGGADYVGPANLTAYGQQPGDVGGAVRDSSGRIVGVSDPSFGTTSSAMGSTPSPSVVSSSSSMGSVSSHRASSYSSSYGHSNEIDLGPIIEGIISDVLREVSIYVPVEIDGREVVRVVTEGMRNRRIEMG